MEKSEVVPKVKDTDVDDLTKHTLQIEINEKDFECCVSYSLYDAYT